MEYRKITKDEKRLLSHLINKSAITLPQNWESQLKVQNLNDGNMGSLYLSLTPIEKKEREYGKTVSECHFKDSDGVDVIVSLNLDKEGNLFELDVWKVNFTELKNIPLAFD
jgi:hypothetical protein